MDLFSVSKWIKSTSVSMISTAIGLSVLIMSTKSQEGRIIRKMRAVMADYTLKG